MLKKTLAILMAAILALGIFAIGVSAEDVEEPTYVPVEHKIEDIIAAVEAKKDYIINPTDIILLPEVEEPEETDPEVEATAESAAISPVLIVEYYAGQDAASEKKVQKFMDYTESGYAVFGVGPNEIPQYAYVSGTRQTNYAIDFVNANEYGFKYWKVTSVYSGPEFNRVVLEAEWDVPALSGWAGYKTMMRGYIKTIIDYVINYLAEMFARIGDFLV